MSEKIQLIIWSKNRACQLETLLDSIQRFAPDIFDIFVLYNYTDEFKQGYYKLIEIKCEEVNFCRKLDGQGKDHLLFLLNEIKVPIVCFTTDDTILYQRPPENPQRYMNDCDIFSLRLGKNTTVQNYATREIQPVLIANETMICDEPFETKSLYFYGPVLDWNFTQYPPLCNYGYPFGLDMVCYRKNMIVPLIEQCNFDKPNELESQLIRFRGSVNPRMKCFEHSLAVNVPITNMSNITSSVGVSLEELNTQFLSGKKLRYKPTDIVGCHQVLEYEFIS